MKGRRLLTSLLQSKFPERLEIVPLKILPKKQYDSLTINKHVECIFCLIKHLQDQVVVFLVSFFKRHHLLYLHCELSMKVDIPLQKTANLRKDR